MDVPDGSTERHPSQRKRGELETKKIKKGIPKKLASTESGGTYRHSQVKQGMGGCIRQRS